MPPTLVLTCKASGRACTRARLDGCGGRTAEAPLTTRVLTTKSPQLAASRMAMQNASVREQFRKIRPRTSTFRTCCAAAHRVRRVQPPQRAARNGQHAAQRAPTEPERRPSVHVGVHAVCVHARACVRQARLRRMDGSEELNAVVQLVTRAHLLQNLLGPQAVLQQ